MERQWLEVCNEEIIERDDAYEFIHNEHVIGIFRIEKGIFALDGLCSHEKANLIDGYIHDDIVECPKHNARFRITSGEALKRPACINLNTYPIKVENAMIFIYL